MQGSTRRLKRLLMGTSVGAWSAAQSRVLLPPHPSDGEVCGGQGFRTPSAPPAPALGYFQLLQRPMRGMEHDCWARRGWSATNSLGSSGDSSLLLTIVWPEDSQLSGSQKLLDHSLAPFITPNRAMIRSGRLIIVEFTHPSIDNLWRRRWAGAAHSSPAIAHGT